MLEMTSCQMFMYVRKTCISRVWCFLLSLGEEVSWRSLMKHQEQERKGWSSLIFLHRKLEGSQSELLKQIRLSLNFFPHTFPSSSLSFPLFASLLFSSFLSSHSFKWRRYPLKGKEGRHDVNFSFVMMLLLFFSREYLWENPRKMRRRKQENHLPWSLQSLHHIIITFNDFLARDTFSLHSWLWISDEKKMLLLPHFNPCLDSLW